MTWSWIVRVLSRLLGGVLVGAGLFMQHGLRWLYLGAGVALCIATLVGVGLGRAAQRGRRRGVFVARPGADDPGTLQWTRVEYQDDGSHRTESAMEPGGRVPPAGEQRRCDSEELKHQRS